MLRGVCIALVTLFLFGMFFFYKIGNVNAQSCGGTYQCQQPNFNCPDGVPQGDPSCVLTCIWQGLSCPATSQSACTNGTFVNGCGAGGLCGNEIISACYWNACTSDSQCPSYPNQRCCGGAPNYCSSVGFDCSGNPLAPPASPTPCPAVGGNYRTFCSGNSLMESYNNGSCGTTTNSIQSCSTCRTISASQAACCTYDGVRCGGYDNVGPTPFAGGAGCGGLYEDRWVCQTGPGNPTFYDFDSCTSADCVNACRTCNWCSVGNGDCTVGSTPVPTASPAPTIPGATATPTTVPTATPTNAPNTYTIGGRVCIGTGNYNTVCDGAESVYPGPVTIRINPDTAGPPTIVLNQSNGLFSRNNLASDGYAVSVATIPSGYRLINLVNNPQNVNVGPSVFNVHFPIRPNRIMGGVFIDADSDGLWDCSGACNNGAGDELHYSGATLSMDGGTLVDVSNSSGYELSPVTNGTRSVALTVPSGYGMTTANPRSVVINDNDQTGINFGIEQVFECSDGVDNDGDGYSDTNDTGCHSDNDPDNPATYVPTDTSELPPGSTQCSDNIDNDGDGNADGADDECHTDGDASDGDNTFDPNDDSEVDAPVCIGGMTANPGTVPAGGDSDLSVANCSNVGSPPGVNYDWNPTTPGDPAVCSTAAVNVDTTGATGSTATWTAPACPSSQVVCQPSVDVTGSGGTTTYTTTVTVNAAYSVAVNVREVGSAGGIGSCDPTAGSAYDGANVNISGGTLPVGGLTQPAPGGATTFACVPGGNYQLTLAVPSGYSVVGSEVTPAAETPVGSNGLSFTVNADQTATFCIAPTDPWFQTDLGDVRYLNLTNPVPTGNYGSSDPTYPGIFYSSESSVNVGAGAASLQNWVVNNEYSFNANTENRNGGMSYDFYKARASQDGVSITPISSGTFVEGEITGSGIYEANSDLTINNYTHTDGNRVVILVDGNVTINNEISVPVGDGLFIVAAKGNITIAETVGTATLNSNTSTLDGYYSAQGSIILESVGNGCADGSTSDLKLNVGGALIANALKPFSTTGTGSVQNRRSLCLENLDYPSLRVNSRPDFLIQMTDFYKTSYTKWKEVNP